MMARLADARDPHVVAHRGASAALAEHTLPAYELALAEGADGLECDVRLTRDDHLVCIHDRTIDRTSAGSGIVSEMSLAELAEHDFGSWHGDSAPASILELDTLLELVLDQERPVKLFIETKHPVRFGAKVESQVLAALSRFGIGTPASASHSRVVVMSFSARAVWRIRRAAPMLPTVLLGDGARYVAGGAAATVGATAIGPSVAALRANPGMVDRAAASGRSTYGWIADEATDVELCRELGVGWVATNHPGRTKQLLARMRG